MRSLFSEDTATQPTTDAVSRSQRLRLLPSRLVDVCGSDESTPVCNGVLLAQCQRHEGFGHRKHETRKVEAACLDELSGSVGK